MGNDIQTMLLRQLVTQVEVIADRLGESAQPSSVEIKTSARGFDVAVKCYVGSSVREAGDDAIAEYTRVFRELESQLMAGMDKTAKALR